MPDKGHRSPEPSAKVAQLLQTEEWSPACIGLAAVADWRIRRRTNEHESHFLDVFAGKRHVQVCISPTGRSVRVYVDGHEA